MAKEKFIVQNKTTNQNFRCSIESDGHYFVYSPKRTRYGWRYTKDEFDQKFIIVPEKRTKNDKWHHDIQTVLKKLSKSGLWQHLIPIFENLLKMTYDEHKDLIRLWTSGQTQTAVILYQKQFPFAFTTDDYGNIIINTDYTNETSDCQLKSMYFGKAFNRRIKSEIKHALETKTTYSSPRIRVSYDVTFNYNNTRKEAWYLEEYRNYRNGHYYLALDENTALFCEND